MMPNNIGFKFEEKLNHCYLYSHDKSYLQRFEQGNNYINIIGHFLDVRYYDNSKKEIL